MHASVAGGQPDLKAELEYMDMDDILTYISYMHTYTYVHRVVQADNLKAELEYMDDKSNARSEAVRLTLQHLQTQMQARDLYLYIHT